MLQAILHGKAGRIDTDEGESQSWREVFKQREDLMTAAVFGRFAYLSAPVQSYLMQSWLGVTEPAFDDFETIDFWSNYDLENNHNQKRVEPDVVLRFKTANVIIEVKPPAGGDQYKDQWQREIEAFLQSDEQTHLPLYFVALGRIPNKQTSEQWFTELQDEFKEKLSGIYALEWQPVVNTLLELKKGELPNVQDRRVIDDILQAAQLYHLKTSGYGWDALLNASLPKLSLEHLLFKNPIKTNWDELLNYTQQLPLSLKDITAWKK
ncbi:hypothetical protein [Vibrio salinus]|uniref:hypothetical protein n=1 Tax=Vibrio salinus TaxID=2899784 RepID=UPI001E3A8CA3|nr:hypothetical protein [Vibrio salinus]MCE0493120.1 hypothetical protein [Vibrio salinus]